MLVILRLTFGPVEVGEGQDSGGENGLSPRKSRVLGSLPIILILSFFLLSFSGMGIFESLG